MSAIGMAPRDAQAWSRVGVASAEVAVADRDALGTTARIVVWPAQNLVRLLGVVDRELDMLDRHVTDFPRLRPRLRADGATHTGTGADSGPATGLAGGAAE